MISLNPLSVTNFLILPKNATKAWKSPRWMIILLHQSLLFQTMWKALIAVPISNVICVYLMLPCLASFWEISKISTRVRYSVIAACIRGKYVIFVGATSFIAYIGARNLTDLGTPWEVSTLSINFYKFNNRRSQVTFFCMITFLGICVVHNFEFVLG